jgi:HEAT repeat protein
MNRIKLIIISLCLLLTVGAEAQLQKGRTTSTIIADALAQLPADNPQKYNLVIADLVSTGEEGLLDLIGRMNPPGPESNEAYDFAISGWTHFASNDEANRAIAASAFEKALNKNLDKEVKAFVIRNLRVVASDANVEVLSGFLTDEYFCGAASAALTSIGTEKAEAALITTLTASKSEQINLHLVNALGQIKLKNAKPVLLNLLSSNPSSRMERVLLNSLSNIGGKESIKPLKEAAEKVELAYGKSNAVDAYIKLLNRLSSTEAKAVKKEVESLLSKAKKQNQSELKIAATKIMLNQPKADATKILKDVINNGDIKYLTSILNAYPFENDKKAVELLQKALTSKNSNDVQTAIIYWLGNKKYESSVSIITPLLKTSDKMLLKAATQSLSKIGGEKSILALAGLLKSGDDETVNLAKNALLSIEGDISYTLASVFDGCGDTGKKAIHEIISSRILESQYSLVYNQMFSDNKAVKAAAANTLKYIVKYENLNDMFTLLEQSDSEYIPAIQASINAALKSLSDTEKTNLVSERISKSNKKHLYYSALASIGTSDAIKQIVEAYNKEKGTNRDAAFTALASVNSFDAIYPVLDIARSTTDKSELEKTADALINIVRRSNQTGEIKYLYLREAMEYAQKDAQKNFILSLIGGTAHYPAMGYIAKFMDDKALSESAARAAMNIALSNTEFASEETTAILNKVSKTLTNPDADYQRQSIKKYLAENSAEGGYVSLFNGKNLDGWKGLVGNPIIRSKMSAKELAAAQVKADKQMALDWKVEDGLIVFDSKGFDNLCTEKLYGDFEILIDWKLYPGAEPDAGLYLRGTPQVQIWDTARIDAGAQVGSGGLYNNQQNPSKPLKVADQRVGDWNTFKIRMVGERVSVWLNGVLVTDNVVLENYWDRSQPIFPIEQIELQAHGSKVAYRDIYIKEITRPEPFKLSAEEKAEGFRILFDGTNLDKWTGNKKDYTVESGNIVLYPTTDGSGGNLYTSEEFDNFIFRFEFMLTPGANNGLGIRTPSSGDAAYNGMELQILDNTAPIYANLEKYQYHGSVYGVIPAKRGALKPIGEWNYQEVIADGDNIKITLNGTTIVEGNIREASKNGTIDGKNHPGLLNPSGHIGFLGHGSEVKFKNIRVKEIE